MSGLEFLLHQGLAVGTGIELDKLIKKTEKYMITNIFTKMYGITTPSVSKNNKRVDAFAHYHKCQNGCQLCMCSNPHEPDEMDRLLESRQQRESESGEEPKAGEEDIEGSSSSLIGEEERCE